MKMIKKFDIDILTGHNIKCFVQHYFSMSSVVSKVVSNFVTIASDNTQIMNILFSFLFGCCIYLFKMISLYIRIVTSALLFVFWPFVLRLRRNPTHQTSFRWQSLKMRLENDTFNPMKIIPLLQIAIKVYNFILTHVITFRYLETTAQVITSSIKTSNSDIS